MNTPTRAELERVALKLISIYKPLMIEYGCNGVHTFGFMKTKHVSTVLTRDPQKPPKWTYTFMKQTYEHLTTEHLQQLNKSFVIHITTHVSSPNPINEVFLFRADIFNMIECITDAVVVIESKHTSGCTRCGNVEGCKMCSRCKHVKYCCPQCQREHWKEHKPACDQIIALGITKK
jgi:hypothetical protein